MDIEKIRALRKEYKERRNEIYSIKLEVWKDNKFVVNQLRGQALVYEKVIEDLEGLIK